MHALLQSNSTFENFSPFFDFMNHILEVSRGMTEKIKAARTVSEKRVRTKSAVFNNDMVKSEEVEQSK
jgi:hypothetical protein